jgi:phage-related protein
LEALSDTERDCPTLEFIRAQPPDVMNEILAAMKRIERDGLSIARKLRGDIWEVRILYDTNIYRLLFAPIGSHSHILLALECFQKKTQKTPPAKIDLAEARLNDWLRRGTTL